MSGGKRFGSSGYPALGVNPTFNSSSRKLDAKTSKKLYSPKGSTSKFSASPSNRLLNLPRESA